MIKKDYPSEPVNLHIKSLINIIQEKNWVISIKKGNGKLPIFRGNGERVIIFYDEWHIQVYKKGPNTILDQTSSPIYMCVYELLLWICIFNCLE